jgi:magnesium chelatase subunit H
MMPKRIMHGSLAPKVRVVIVTLDNHLSGAAERAAAQLAREGSGISIAFHAAADWDRNPASLARCHDDIASGDIIIATMLFLEDHIKAVMPALVARRETCDAMLGIMSASEVVKLTRLGDYRMDKPASGPMALLKKLRGSSKPGQSGGAGQMKMLRRLPKILRFIPGAAQDVRAYFLTLQYWLAGSDDNVVNMVRALVDRYADGERRDLRGTMKPAQPVEYPELGVYHPALPERMTENLSRLARKPKAGTVGLLMLRSYILGRDSAHYDGVIAAMEARGLNVVPAFASGLDSRPAIEAFFMKDGVATVDAVVSLTGFSLVGGPAYNDAKAAEDMLAALDVPYVAAHPLEFQTLEQWGAGRSGLLPLEATMMVAIPELDGAILPATFGGRSDGSGEACTGCARGCTFPTGGLIREMRACPERAEALAAKVDKLVTLRRSERQMRKLALVLFNFPPNAGATGTAAYLSVFESVFATLTRLHAEGYDVTLPASVDALRDALLKGNAERFGADANVHARVAADDHVRREPHLREIEAQWGAAPGKAQADGSSIHIYGTQFGKVFIGVQPSFGYEGDPMRMLFEGTFTPTHAFSAFYRYLREDFAADAVLHFGTHGALEFMPGKQAGLSAKCWPERLIGDLPNFYLYASNNPSEGLIAKRRSSATLISYLTPALTEAGLYAGLSDLKILLDRYRSSPDGEERIALEAMMVEAATALDLDASTPETLATQLYELEETLIPEGLHAINDDELSGVIRALDAKFIRPAPGGDLIRNPDVLPTGRNIHGFDPFRIPSRFAMQDGTAQAEALIARHVADTGSAPTTLAMVLWGTDNLKSEGAQIAQALALIGAAPRFDSYGRLAGAELIPLETLGRPRIDVIVTLSGIFRDLLPLQTRMLADAAFLAASADEPLDQNHVRANSLSHQAKHGCDLETAALRVYSNAEGAYGANVNLMIDNGAWTDPDELANAFESQKGYAYGRSGIASRNKPLFESALATVELAYQNLDSVELGVTTVDHYVDGLGGISRSVARARGEAIPAYIVDATQGTGSKVRTIGEQVDLETRTRMLNPVWYEGMLRHGFEGVRNIEASVTNTMGWSATTEGVSPWIYQKISETYVLDDDMRERLSALNPKSTARMASRLLEASDRHFWAPDAATLAALHAASDAIEDHLEGIAA